MVVNKKQVTFTLSPSVILRYTALVQKHYGNNQVSAQVELLIRNETARLSGNLDEMLHGMANTLRDTANGIKNSDSKDGLNKVVDSLEVWTSANRGVEFQANDISTNYEMLQTKYLSRVKRCDELIATLKQKAAYDDLLDLAIEHGLDLNSDMGNLDKVVAEMFAESAKLQLHPGYLQLFVNMLEIGKQKRAIEKDLRHIQQQKYGLPNS